MPHLCSKKQNFGGTWWDVIEHFHSDESVGATGLSLFIFFPNYVGAIWVWSDLQSCNLLFPDRFQGHGG